MARSPSCNLPDGRRRARWPGRGAFRRGLAGLFLGAGLVASALPAPVYEVVPGWPVLPPGEKLGLCAGVGVDSRHRVYVFHRRERKWSTPFPEAPIAGATVSVFAGATGEQLAAWGAGEFVMPHGLTVDGEDCLWLTDVGRQQVFKYTAEGLLLLTVGERGVPGADRTHFNFPTDVAVLPDGSFYVSDGYRNTRVVKFDAKGQYQFEWGRPGAGPGEFNLPHGLAVDAQGRIYVCDRSNARVQVFGPHGDFLAQWKGPALGRPYGIDAGLGGHLFLIDGGDQSETAPDHARVVELDPQGRVVNSFGSYGTAPGQFQMGHDLAVDRDGTVYVAEGKGGRVQKFARLASPP